MALNIRRLMRNGKNQTRTAGEYATEKPKSSAAVKSKSPAIVVKGRTVDVQKVNAQAKDEMTARSKEMVAERKEFLETAAGPDGIAGGGIVSKTAYMSLLEGYVHTDIDAEDAAQIGKANNSMIHRIYKDMYYHDPVCGMAVDLVSTMPYSDFSLAGAKDSKVYQKYEDSIYNMNTKSLLRVLSTEFMVQGLFVSTNVFDESEGVFTGLVPQRIDLVDVMPVPVFGRDPLITLRVGEAFKSMASDPRMKEYMDIIQPSNDTLQPKPEDVTYIARQGLLRDYRGVSIYRRILSAWLLERALFRGTLDQAMKRQRAITHLMAGDTEWTPTQEEMAEIADNLIAADLDPVGAIFVTRTGVAVNDVRSANDLWKVTDLTDFFTTAKLRSLGISEAFLSGDASYNSLEQAMSVFVEQMRSFRDMITYELFYDKTFPRIAKANDFMRKRYAIDVAGGEVVNPGQMDLFTPDDYSRLWKDHSAGPLGGSYFTREERRDLFIPQVQWHKRLRPEADAEYLGLLATLQENNVPVPLRIWAAAGGLDIDTLQNQKDDDLALRKELKDWMKVIKPPEMGEGGGMPGMGGGDEGGAGDSLDLSSLLTAGHTRNRNLLTRFEGVDPEAYGGRNMAGQKRHIMSAKGQKIMEEKINKQIAEVASSVGASVNRMEKRIEEMQRDFRTTRFYTG